MEAATPEAHPELAALLETLHDNAPRWLELGPSEILPLLEETRERTLAVAEAWVEASGNAKGLDPDSPLRGEEWSSGPWAVLAGLNGLIFTLGQIAAGNDPLSGMQVRTRPDGQVLVAGWGETYGLLDTRGMGTWTFQAQREPIERAFGAAASVAPETLLLTGGVDYVAGVPGEAARTAITVDLSGGTPAVVPTGAMTFARADHDATVLAAGSGLVSGGDRFHAEDGAPTAVRVPEAWDPGTGLFTIYAAASEPRGYRSTAVLLPDGRVWTGGGACGAGCTSNLTAEVFRPPYLFAPDGQLAVRPTLTSASSTALYGASFDLSVAGGTPISRITAVRAGAATHGVDADQRFLELSFTQSGSSLDVESPVNGDVAPPGPYLVFAFDANGVPSVARIVRFGEPTPSAWEFVVTSDGSLATGRHEAAIANVGGKLYLMGGRGARPTEEYDTVARTWRQLGLPPFEIHHFQPVVIDGLVYVIGAHTGPFPNEANVARIWTYDPTTDDWAQGPQIPAARRRGSGGTFVRDGKIYLLCGNNQGHNGGARAWFDEYDPVTQAWTVLPDAPRARDHFQTALIGDRLVVSGGRATTLPNPFDGTIGEVDIYDFSTGTWSTVAQAIPTQRAGTMTVQIGRYAVVVGGESDAMTAAHRDVEAFDALSEEWTILPPLVRGRHSGGMGVVDGRIYVASGSGNAGGTPELPSSEALDGAGVLDDLDANLVENGDFSAGFAGWLSGGSSQLVPEGGIAAPGALVQSGNLRRVFPAQAGVTYSVRLLYTATGGGASSVELFARDGGGSNLASTSSGLGPATTLSLGSVDWLAPPGTESILVRISASGGRTLLVDDVVVTD
ncbi:MAG: galactose oxidase-like domain-containing protein [Planctomycetota bacterium]